MDKKEIAHTINIYKQILKHLQEHIEEGNFDNLDVSQSNILINEIDKLMKLKGGASKDEIYKWSDPKQAQKMAIKYLGKYAILYKSEKPSKKYKILDPENDKWVHFGQMGYEDFTKHQDEERRKRYLTRTANMRGNWKENPYSANNLSRNILW